MIGVSLLLWALAADGGISRWDGLLFVVLLSVYTFAARHGERRRGQSPFRRTPCLNRP